MYVWVSEYAMGFSFYTVFSLYLIFFFSFQERCFRIFVCCLICLLWCYIHVFTMYLLDNSLFYFFPTFPSLPYFCITFIWQSAVGPIKTHTRHTLPSFKNQSNLCCNASKSTKTQLGSLLRHIEPIILVKGSSFLTMYFIKQVHIYFSNLVISKALSGKPFLSRAMDMYLTLLDFDITTHSFLVTYNALSIYIWLK